ncbi:MAG: hypothetical protein A2X08_17270 [Bacteroidetes bacterium GWA2_32_17]|nr:MAG: hypothetical protein A2X08_17270 [Bacteroidetes bacterium GWA2_32_17]
MTNSNNILPKHWQIKKLGGVCKLKNGYAFKSDNYKNEGIPVIRISDINGGTVSSNKAVRVIANNEYDNYLVENNDILVAMSGATTGKFGIYKSSEKAYQNQRVGKFKILNEDILNNQFLFYQINSLKRQIEKDAYGGAQPNISSTKIEEMQIALPPLSEQQAIVSKIEELLSDLENGKQQLLTAQQQLKVYRQSLLKWAFEGKLTNINVNEGKIPKGWKWVKLGEVCSNVEYGSATKSKESGKMPVLRMGNIQKCRFDWNDLVYTDDDTEIKKYLLKRNDVLFNRTNSAEWVGKTAIYKGERPAIFAGYLIRINRIENLIDADYLTYYLNTHAAKQYGNTVRSFGVNQSNINGTKLKTYPIPLPTLKEQKLIVEDLESKLTVCDKIEETITNSLKQVETLRQSILKRAFEGRLV